MRMDELSSDSSEEGKPGRKAHKSRLSRDFSPIRQPTTVGEGIDMGIDMSNTIGGGLAEQGKFPEFVLSGSGMGDNVGFSFDEDSDLARSTSDANPLAQSLPLPNENKETVEP